MAGGRQRAQGPGAVVQFEVAFSMPAYTTDALILRTYKLGESDRIVVFLTRDRGKRRGVAKNAGKSRARFGRRAGAADARPRRLPGARAARSGARAVCRAAAFAAGGGRWRRSRLHRLLRGTDRRV